MQRTSEAKTTYIPFYRLYTPYVLHTTAEFTSSRSYSPTALSFGTDSPGSKRLFKLPLISANILNRNADITVVMTVGLQSSVRSSDSDPKFYLSDGERGIGFESRNEAPYCRGMQAVMGDTMSSSKSLTEGARPQTSVLSEEFVFTINRSPYQNWGSCLYGMDSGLISPVTYTQDVYPDKGLWLEVYREDPGEQYAINYIIVEIHEN